MTYKCSLDREGIHQRCCKDGEECAKCGKQHKEGGGGMFGWHRAEWADGNLDSQLIVRDS